MGDEQRSRAGRPWATPGPPPVVGTREVRTRAQDVELDDVDSSGNRGLEALAGVPGRDRIGSLVADAKRALAFGPSHSIADGRREGGESRQCRRGSLPRS